MARTVSNYSGAALAQHPHTHYRAPQLRASTSFTTRMRFCAVAGVGAGLGWVEARDEESFVPVRLCLAWCWECGRRCMGWESSGCQCQTLKRNGVAACSGNAPPTLGVWLSALTVLIRTRYKVDPGNSEEGPCDGGWGDNGGGAKKEACQ